jgi:membrane protein DedA with SNARE-associated domain
MESVIYIIQGWIGNYGALGVFAASIVEELISVIPSSLVQTGAGIFIMAGSPVTITSVLKLIFVISIPAAVGVTLGSLPYVWLARKYGILAIDRWGKWIGVQKDDLKKMEERLSKTSWDDVVFVAMRAFPVIPSVALAIYGGIIEMSWIRYMTLSFIGVFIRATGLSVLGWLFVSTVDSVSSDVGLLENIGLVVTLILIVIWLFWMKSRKKALK